MTRRVSSGMLCFSYFAWKTGRENRRRTARAVWVLEAVWQERAEDHLGAGCKPGDSVIIK
ncbi:MAG: hypothetical protein HFH48_07035 [Lachnospiraceae bacterium]|nr:hypothetical protein [Lachnospiraceae bacterium]